ncbi:hypothetical protein ABVK25_003080 [Lepraria finkii]|uniref:Uncharacterized protein n=1 Tax=Lepraria finkii TaxID=1340010 RepID=A0ABR4BIP0_9LECA
MASDDSILEGMRKDGKMDYAEWPGLLDRILPRLEHIACNDFPMPRIPLSESLPPLLKDEDTLAKLETPVKEDPLGKLIIQEEPATTKQEPSETQARSPKKRSLSPKLDPSPMKRERTTSPAHSSTPPTTNAVTTIASPPKMLPPPLLSLLQTIQSTLRTSFPTAPPHTSQRLAELLLHPTNHYRTLPSYLRALDRIVSVASPASVFPLPTLAAPTSALADGPLLNGSASPGEQEEGQGPRDMDFIGGAELTEIPWLRSHNTNGGSPGPTGNTTNGGLVGDLRTESTRVIDGPNGAGSMETVSVNMNGVSSHTPHSSDSSTSSNSTGHGITQGELLRQEQEAGIVPVPSSPVRNGRVTRSGAAAAAAAHRGVLGDPPSEALVGDVVEQNEPVHARGPDVIGMEDMGPQTYGSGLAGGLDLEGALGRRGGGGEYGQCCWKGG